MSQVYTQLVPTQGYAVTNQRGNRKLSEEQVRILENHFRNEHKLEAESKDKLALELGLDPRQVEVWFQNRRSRWKKKKLEEDCSKLKLTNESIAVEKCLLESEVLKLKEKLYEAEKEIERLSVLCADRSNIVLPMEAIEPPVFGEFGMAGGYDQEPFYDMANNYNNYVSDDTDDLFNFNLW